MSSDVLDELHSVRDWVRYGASMFEREGLFFGHGTDNAWDEAALLVLWCLDQPWQRLHDCMDARISYQERQQVLDALRRRAIERVPAAYITGEMYFAGMKFKVSADVLVPRSPLAELIERGFEPWLSHYPASILDMCCGSGCIGIACAAAFDAASVDLADISDKAIAIARENIDMHGLKSRVRAINSDGFSGLSGTQYDLIVSNPPYVSEEEYRSLPAEYHAEPEIGLSSGADGLDFTRGFLAQAAAHLNDDGIVVVEVGHTWEVLVEAYPQVPFFWPEFEHGGCGVFILTKQQLQEFF